MPNLSSRITETQIRRGCNSQSFAKGEALYLEDAVSLQSLNGNLLNATVEGSRGDEYSVTLSLIDPNSIDAACNCPYSLDGWCKHIVAVLLHCSNVPEDGLSVFDLTSALIPLDRNDLQSILLQLVEQQPKLIEPLKLELARRMASRSAANKKATGSDQSHIYMMSPADARERVAKAMSRALKIGAETYYFDDDGSQVSSEIWEAVNPLLDIVGKSMLVGDTTYAISLLEAITDELVSNWNDIEDYLYCDEELFTNIGDAWANAFLLPGVNPTDRIGWLTAIEGWQSRGADIGAEAGLEHASRAAREGWENSELQAKLQADVLSPFTGGEELDEAGIRLSELRVKMLTMQGRVEDAAKLAGADGLLDNYMELLVELGQIQEAVQFGLRNMEGPHSALKLAQLLTERGEPQFALTIAEHGLSLRGNPYDLAVWTRDVAISSGLPDLAIRAGVMAVREDAQLDDYVALQQIAAGQWSSLREELLDEMRQLNQRLDDGLVDILLHEGMYQEALDAANRSYSYTLLERVVEACMAYCPEQIIAVCRSQAERILGAAKSDRYQYAIRWLTLMRDAYSTMNRSNEWLLYKNSLLSLHSRKSAFTPGLKRL